jgi:FlaA1/EpsC-like NDP-sugar epimerase
LTQLTLPRAPTIRSVIGDESKREHASYVPGNPRLGKRKGPSPTDDVSVETLLGRSVVEVDCGKFCAYLADATVLVTGAGGSVGSELCARLAQLGVRELVLVDQAEASLIGAARSLQEDLEFANGVAVLADIKSRTRAVEMFERYQPDVIFHAAAYKHVPLLEAFPVEGVATNVLGTRSVVDAARRVGVGRFVLFSTDKAVQPTNILGQTKSIAEWIVAAAGDDAAHGRYATVRLGNVIDSAGSILPIFRQQLASDGPLTVTHRRATRYLMTAGEAAGLAIVAGAFADSNSVFFLDSGPPVCVLDLAQRLASAAARHIDIEFVGLRAGERLHEQLFWAGDDISATPCERVLGSTMHRVDPTWLEGWLTVLARHVKRASAAGVRAVLAEMHEAPELGGIRPAAARR